MDKTNYDFSGWATRNNLRCSDGRTILRDAFIEDDGEERPLVWNHQHNSPENVLGKVLLENRPDGVYAYGKFNDTPSGRQAKLLVQHGDITGLSIMANKLKQDNARNVSHGKIREVSLVLAQANPGAGIDFVLEHSDWGEETVFITADEPLSLYLEHSDEKGETMANENKNTGDETMEEILDTLNEKQKAAVYALVGEALKADPKKYNSEEDDEDEGDEKMKHGWDAFSEEEAEANNTLSHADQEAIITLAKQGGVGSFQTALKMYVEDNETLAHGVFGETETIQLFPDYELMDPKKPEVIYDDDSWVAGVLSGVHKSPYTRIRTRKADARKKAVEAELRAKGYKKGTEKTLIKKIKLIGRTHDAQTVYVKDELNRDDILDITDFDLVQYNWEVMRHTMNQELATAILVGDGRTDLDPDKIKEDHIRPIWKDDEVYCLHFDIDIAAMTNELQGTNTGANFGTNFIFTEALITKSLYAREQYNGSGIKEFYCTPHTVNQMLLARNIAGERMYKTRSDLASALNVDRIVTIEQFENLTRTTEDGKVKKLLGLFVNLKDYQLGCVKGGQLTTFNQFDIDFNKEKMLLEGRFSGGLVELASAIALEIDVTPASGDGDE